MRFIVRFVSLLLLVAAVMAAVLDSIQSVAANQIFMTPLGATIFSLGPDMLVFLENTMREYLPLYAWDPLMLWVLAQPTFAVLLVLSLVFWIVAYRRTPAAGRFAA